jgi:hypothetical protein
MAFHGIAVQRLSDGSILRLQADAVCVPVPDTLDGSRVDVHSIEHGFDEIACVTYSDGAGLAGYVVGEARLGTRGAGDVVIVRAPDHRPLERQWLVVRVVAEQHSAAAWR